MLNASWRLVHNLVLLGTTLAVFSKGHTQTEVLTRSYDNSRTGANLTEKVLSPQNVRKLGLKRRFKIELSQDDHPSIRPGGAHPEPQRREPAYGRLQQPAFPSALGSACASSQPLVESGVFL
ncbi:hypothetical protein [Bradyrhizobium sp.]|jgi:hypothetical protein|uniref:hypothetical protein n=1 Tax=Bradyrhizobium sp. TaxID=376 RepID=UPI002C57E291|nr:hypothetical protein [Bradyrhizobium sp.]HWX60511.1 hypothetical protein [Bradyrhizobium sp.]